MFLLSADFQPEQWDSFIPSDFPRCAAVDLRQLGEGQTGVSLDASSMDEMAYVSSTSLYNMNTKSWWPKMSFICP